MKPRTIKIEESGDFWSGDVKPRIRLTGRWLDKAGFKAGHRVDVEFHKTGVLVLRFVHRGNQTP